MFCEVGIKSVRMDDIASKCGISKRTLYEQFSDRGDLIRSSLNYYFDRYDQQSQEKLLAAENVIDEFWIMFNQGSDVRGANKVMMSDLIKFYPGIFKEFFDSHHNLLIEKNRDRFERGQEEGLILQNVDAGMMARMLTTYLYGIGRDYDEASWMERDMEKRLTPDLFRFIIMLYFRGLTTEKGRKYIDENILVGIK